MSELWYNNFKVLLDQPSQYLPSKDLTNSQKANALARLGIYMIAIIYLLKLENSYLSLPFLILVSSFLVGNKEGFSNEYTKKCVMPTESNPFMNFTIDDYYKNPNRPKNCPVDKVRGEMRKQFLKRVVPDPTDLWGQNFSDRSFYTMPSTQIVNEQTKFANWCYGTMGKCKSSGKNCLKYAQSRTGVGMFGSAL